MRLWLSVNLTLWFFVVLVNSYALVTRPWEYRAVYHYDCNSYMTEH